MQINWKKTGLFILFLIIGVFVFYGISILSNYLSQILILIFFILYIIFLFLTIKKFSRVMLIITILVPIIYLILMLIPFAECHRSSREVFDVKECACLGFEKYDFMTLDVYRSKCIGIVKEYKCYRYEKDSNNDKHEIPCSEYLK